MGVCCSLCASFHEPLPPTDNQLGPPQLAAEGVGPALCDPSRLPHTVAATQRKLLCTPKCLKRVPGARLPAGSSPAQTGTELNSCRRATAAVCSMSVYAIGALQQPLAGCICAVPAAVHSYYDVRHCRNTGGRLRYGLFSP